MACGPDNQWLSNDVMITQEGEYSMRERRLQREEVFPETECECEFDEEERDRRQSPLFGSISLHLQCRLYIRIHTNKYT